MGQWQETPVSFFFIGFSEGRSPRENSFLDFIHGERLPVQETGTAKKRPAGEFITVDEIRK